MGSLSCVTLILTQTRILAPQKVASLRLAFEKADVSGTGSLAQSEVEALIREASRNPKTHPRWTTRPDRCTTRLQSYKPSEEETSNVFHCLDVSEVLHSIVRTVSLPAKLVQSPDLLPAECTHFAKTDFAPWYQDGVIVFDEFLFGFWRFYSGKFQSPPGFPV